MDTPPLLPQSSDSDLEAAKQAFSWSRFRESVDEQVRNAGPTLGFIFRHRFWFVAASCATLFIGVLENDNTACLNWSQSTSLTGLDVLVPVITKVNLFSGAISSRAFSIHPLGVLSYFPLAIHLYFLFVRHFFPIRWAIWQGMVQTISTLLLPFLHITLLTIVLPGFRSSWHPQSPLFGFWILLGCGAALTSSSYGELLKRRAAIVTPPLS